MTDSVATVVADTSVIAAAVIAAVCCYMRRNQLPFPSKEPSGYLRPWVGMGIASANENKLAISSIGVKRTMFVRA